MKAWFLWGLLLVVYYDQPKASSEDNLFDIHTIGKKFFQAVWKTLDYKNY